MTRGRLVYVIGASGCGKDSVMAHAREQCLGKRIAFAHRYITRAASAGGENHVHLEPGEFSARLADGLFALNWESHGLSYGIGVEIDRWMEAGFTVVANGSRAYLPEAATRYPDMVPVLITVSPEELRRRLLARGRESEAEVERRLARAGAYEVRHPELVTIGNDGALEEAGDKLVHLLESITPGGR